MVIENNISIKNEFKYQTFLNNFTIVWEKQNLIERIKYDNKNKLFFYSKYNYYNYYDYNNYKLNIYGFSFHYNDINIDSYKSDKIEFNMKKNNIKITNIINFHIYFYNKNFYDIID